MRHVSYIVAAAGLAVALAGCGDPYYPRYGTSQSYYSPSGYTYAPADYSYTPSGLRLRAGGQQQLQLAVRLLPQLQRHPRRAGADLSLAAESTGMDLPRCAFRPFAGVAKGKTQLNFLSPARGERGARRGGNDVRIPLTQPLPLAGRAIAYDYFFPSSRAKPPEGRRSRGTYFVAGSPE